MNELTNAVVTIALAIVGVALLATLVSRNANTVGVINAGGGAFARGLNAATAPITGGGMFGGSMGNSQFGPGYY
jgi:hypothetical protein